MPGFVYDPSKGLFRSYLKTVVMNAISRRFRQNPSGPGLSAVGEPEARATDEDDAHWEQEWRQYHLRTAMRIVATEFGDKDMGAFEQYALQGREAGAVAAELGLSVESVYQAKSRILRRLSKVIEAQVAEEG